MVGLLSSGPASAHSVYDSEKFMAPDSSRIDLLNLKEGETWIRGMELSFVNVPITADGIDTVAWLTALESIIYFVEVLAPTAAGLTAGWIKSDIQNIRNLYNSAPLQCRTLQLLVRHEQPLPSKLATVGLMWNFRRLKLLAISFRSSLDHPAEELSQSFTFGWNSYYRKFYPWIVHPLFKLFIRWTPSRAKLYQQLGGGSAKGELRVYLDAIDSQTAALEELYASL